MESELDMLKRQKKELEKRIKELTSGYPVILGRVRLNKQHFVGIENDRYYISFEANGFYNTRSRFVSLTNGSTRKEVLDAIPQIIEELQAFYDTYKDVDE